MTSKDKQTVCWEMVEVNNALNPAVLCTADAHYNNHKKPQINETVLILHACLTALCTENVLVYQRWYCYDQRQTRALGELFISKLVTPVGLFQV